MSETASPVNADALSNNDTVNKAQKLRKRNKKKSRKQRLAKESQKKVKEKEKESVTYTFFLQEAEAEQNNSLDNVEIEYIVQPIDASTLKKVDGWSKMDENSLQQFSDIFKHFQTGKPEQDDEVSEIDMWFQ